MSKTTKCVVARSKLMRVKRSLSVVNCKRHPALRLSPLHRSQSPLLRSGQCGPPMIPLRAYWPTGAKWTCAGRIRWAVDPQRTSLARCHLPAAATEGLSSLQFCNSPCSRRSRLHVLVFALPPFPNPSNLALSSTPHLRTWLCPHPPFSSCSFFSVRLYPYR